MWSERGWVRTNPAPLLLQSSESASHMSASDVTFCNSLRMRLKDWLFIACGRVALINIQKGKSLGGCVRRCECMRASVQNQLQLQLLQLACESVRESSESSVWLDSL